MPKGLIVFRIVHNHRYMNIKALQCPFYETILLVEYSLFHLPHVLVLTKFSYPDLDNSVKSRRDKSFNQSIADAVYKRKNDKHDSSSIKKSDHSKQMQGKALDFSIIY